MNWDSDNDAEADAIVECILNAARQQAHEEIEEVQSDARCIRERSTNALGAGMLKGPTPTITPHDGHAMLRLTKRTAMTGRQN